MPPNRKLNLDALYEIDVDSLAFSSDLHSKGPDDVEGIPEYTKPIATSILVEAAEVNQKELSSSSCTPLQPPQEQAAVAATEDDDGYFHHDIEEQANETTLKDRKNHAYNDTTNNESEPEEPNRVARRLIKQLSSIVQDPSELTIDERRLQRSMKDAGEYAYGIQAIAVWFFDEDQDRLVPANAGFWYNSGSVPESDSLQRLIDPQRKDHVPKVPVPPGVDIAGILWLESKKIDRGRVPSFMRPVMSFNRLGGAQSNESFGRVGVHQDYAGEKTMIWRDLKSLVEDPDTAKGPRLILLEEAGFGQATGIPFKTHLSTGLIIFFAQRDLDSDILNGTANISYLQHAAHFIGAAAGMGEARRATIGHRIRKSMRVSPYNDEEDPSSSSPLPPLEPEKKKEDPLPLKEDSKAAAAAAAAAVAASSSCLVVPHRLRVWLKKTKGGDLQIPPALSLRQSLWTCLGCFCGLLVLSSLNEYYSYLSDEDLYLLIGPFGALMTLQYGLTAAPASQPRNAVMGQAVAGAVSMAFTYIPESIMAVWLRTAIGPAVAIATMVKLGYTHPPAGAHAVIYASGQFGWAFYALVVLSSAISIIPATLVNNMSIKRQYPTYWGFTDVPIWIQNIMKKRKKKKKQDCPPKQQSK